MPVVATLLTLGPGQLSESAPPTFLPTTLPTVEPTPLPTGEPTAMPTPEPTAPTPSPTFMPTPLPTASPTLFDMGSEAGPVGLEEDPSAVCPAPTGDDPCGWSARRAVLWDEKHLEPCPPQLTDLFFEDPATGGVAHACDAGEVHTLPRSCADVIYHGMALDPMGGALYVSTGHSIRRVNLTHVRGGEVGDGPRDLLSGYRTLSITGFNLGSAAEEVTEVAVKGVPCSRVVYHNSTFLQCITGDPGVLSSPIPPDDCVTVTVRGAGASDRAMPEVLAVSRRAAGDRKPIVYRVEVDSVGFEPLAVAVDGVAGRLYWSNRASKTIQTSRLDGSDLRTVATTGVPRVQDLLVDSASGLLYFSEAASGEVRRCPLLDAAHEDLEGGGGAGARLYPCDEAKVVVDGLRQPRGLALDREDGFLFVVEGGYGRIHRVTLDEDGNTPGRHAGLPKQLQVYQAKTTVELAGVAVLPPEDGQNPHFDFSYRLFWTEINSERVQQGTIHGTATRPLPSAPTYGVADPVIWPKGIVADTENALVYVSEYLGRIWELSYTNATHARLVVDQSSFAAASQIKSFLAGNAAIAGGSAAAGRAGGAAGGKKGVVLRLTS